MKALSDAKLAMIDGHVRVIRALEAARQEVGGGNEVRLSRDLLGAVIRLHAASSHTVSVVLSLIEQRQLK